MLGLVSTTTGVVTSVAAESLAAGGASGGPVRLRLPQPHEDGAGGGGPRGRAERRDPAVCPGVRVCRGPPLATRRRRCALDGGQACGASAQRSGERAVATMQGRPAALPVLRSCCPPPAGADSARQETSPDVFSPRETEDVLKCVDDGRAQGSRQALRLYGVGLLRIRAFPRKARAGWTRVAGRRPFVMLTDVFFFIVVKSV